MKKSDILFLLFVTALFLPFFISDAIYEWYQSFNATHGMVMSFMKFAILALWVKCSGFVSAQEYITTKPLASFHEWWYGACWAWVSIWL